MKNLLIVTSLLILITTVIVGCNTTSPTTLVSGDQPIDDQQEVVPATDTTTLIAALRRESTKVELAGRIEQPFLSVPGQFLTLDEASIQVFEYDNQADAEAEAARVSPDGHSVGTTVITWIDVPHFYAQGRLIVLYVGSDTDATSSLEAVLGPQFAGG